MDDRIDKGGRVEDPIDDRTDKGGRVMDSTDDGPTDEEKVVKARGASRGPERVEARGALGPKNRRSPGVGRQSTWMGRTSSWLQGKPLTRM
jgi:hypothetical protein